MSESNRRLNLGKVPDYHYPNRAKNWSGWRESNPSSPVWKTGALPLSYTRLVAQVGVGPTVFCL